MEVDDSVNPLKSRSNQTILSDRLNKDVESLMNSSFWVEALKNKQAIGIGRHLYSKLERSKKFMKDFVIYSLGIKKFQLNEIIISSRNEMAASNQTNKKSSMIQIFDSNNKSSSLDSIVTYLNKKALENEAKKSSFDIDLPVDFFIECVFLAIIDSEDCISAAEEIIDKLIQWFPEFDESKNKLNFLVDAILNNTHCFKKIVNVNSIQESNKSTLKPIILGKRKFIWTTNNIYLRSFVRHFYRYQKKKLRFVHLIDSFEQKSVKFSLLYHNDANKNVHNSTSKMKIAHIFESWNTQVEQFKLLIHLKHLNSNHVCYNSQIFPRCDNIYNQADFIKHINPLRSEAKMLKSGYNLSASFVSEKQAVNMDQIKIHADRSLKIMRKKLYSKKIKKLATNDKKIKQQKQISSQNRKGLKRLDKKSEKTIENKVKTNTVISNEVSSNIEPSSSSNSMLISEPLSMVQLDPIPNSSSSIIVSNQSHQVPLIGFQSILIEPKLAIISNACNDLNAQPSNQLNHQPLQLISNNLIATSSIVNSNNDHHKNETFENYCLANLSTFTINDLNNNDYLQISSQPSLNNSNSNCNLQLSNSKYYLLSLSSNPVQSSLVSAAHSHSNISSAFSESNFYQNLQHHQHQQHHQISVAPIHVSNVETSVDELFNDELLFSHENFG